MVPEAETERLLLRPIALDDAAQIQKIFPHWEIVRYLDTRVPWPYPADGARQFIENVALPAVAGGDTWNWTLRLKSEPDRIIGNLELRRGAEDHRGFWIGLPWQNAGLITEACAWANDFWFDALGYPLMRVSKAVENRASRRVSEKLGMRLVGIKEKNYVCGRLPSGVWEITAGEWRAWKRRGIGIREQLESEGVNE
jgi:[ribosomal protein S5]-alanine N-acetyltransferase